MAYTTDLQSTKDSQNNSVQITGEPEQHLQIKTDEKDISLSEKIAFGKLKEKAVSLQEAREHTLHFINNLSWKE